jgi:ABC-type uncharacterized transport system substrate-binding protein
LDDPADRIGRLEIMWHVVRRLLLGLALIALASAGLLFSDTSRRRAQTSERSAPRVAILQHASQPIIDEGIRGMLEGLAAAGYEDGTTLEVSRFNAENDMATSAAIAAEITSGNYDLLLTATTISFQAVSNANQTRRRPHVFALVTDPAATGVGIGREPFDHPPYMAGYGTMQPVARTIAMAREFFPGLKVVGIPWNPAEANSKISTDLAKKACAELGVEVIEASAENTAAVAEAASSLVARGAQALWTPADVTVLSALGAAVAEANKGRIPMFTNIPGSADQGTLFDVGANYLEVGHHAGALAARVLDGVDMQTLPIENFVPERVTVNPKALEGLRDPWRLTDEVLRSADVVGQPRVADAGVGADRAPAATFPRARLTRKWKVDLLQYVEVQDAEEAQRGIIEGLRKAGLVEGRDFELEERNAQGDMPTLSALVDAALTEGTDLLMTLSTPTLQAAMARGRGKPIVFTFCASGVAAGAGKSDTDHLPNVTGVPSASPYEELLAVARETIPNLRRIGTLLVPSETNSVYNVERLVELAGKQGIEVVQVAVNSITEVPDAATSLFSRDLDAVIQAPSNLTTSSFVSLSRAADSMHTPLFSGLSGDLDNGAAVVMARDYHEAGLRAAALAVRIMNGESPADIPFQPLDTAVLQLNLDAARAQDLEVPPALLARAERVIGKR